MSPVRNVTRYVTEVVVKAVEERKETMRAYKHGEEVKTVEESIGWFITLEGSDASLWLGFEKPEFSPGQTIRLTLEGTK
jgi:hypothetical protein